jgi:hypothetical protein
MKKKYEEPVFEVVAKEPVNDVNLQNENIEDFYEGLFEKQDEKIIKEILRQL